MPPRMRLSELVDQIQDAIDSRFEDETFWVTAEITDVKKYSDKQWCFLKFIEKDGNTITTEIKGVFWRTSYYTIERFEKLANQLFSNGLEITCNVRVRFHQRYGLTLEVLDIDYTYTLGKLELERQETLARLLRENPDSIRLVDGQYVTENNSRDLPAVVQRIALITAPESDGQRDFKQEIGKNRYGYVFSIHEYLVRIQGDNASLFIIQQLKLIEAEKENFDVVVIVRGGGSQTDFKPFDDYELSKYIASFPVPVLTGIGHDRNISIADLMARPHKTPTKTATHIIDHNFSFENEILQLKERFSLRIQQLLNEKITGLGVIKERFKENIYGFIGNRQSELENTMRLVKNLSPSTILSKGFAIITIDGRIITNPAEIANHATLKTILKDEIIHSIVTEKTKYEKQPDL